MIIVSRLSVNVIIHLEEKLNCNQIFKNTFLSKDSVYILSVLCYKDEQMGILLIPPQHEELYYKTSYRNNNAGFDSSYVKSDNIRFSNTYQNISSVEQLYCSISENANTVWLSSIVWKLCPTLWSEYNDLNILPKLPMYSIFLSVWFNIVISILIYVFHFKIHNQLLSMTFIRQSVCIFKIKNIMIIWTI